jgi:gliding motility-associated-like protein
VVKRLFLTSLLLNIFVSISAQSFWAKPQAGGNNDETLDIVSDASGNSYAVGYFSSSAQISGTSASVQGLTDVHVSKVSSAGNTAWVRTFGGPQSDRGLGVAVDGSGNVAVCGFYTGSINFGNGVTLTSVGSQDAFIVKLDANGNALWARTGGSTGGSDRANAVAFDGSGNVVITGQFSGSATFGTFTLDASDGTNDAFIVKYDANGVEQWAKQGTGESLDRGLAIATDNSGAVYATGQFSGDVTFDNTYTNTIQNAIFLIKYSASGNEEWFRWGGGSEESIAYDLASNGSSVFLTGDFGNTLNFLGTGSTVSLSSGFSNSIFLMSITGSGGFAWGETAGSDSNISSRGISISSDNVAITGYFECTFDTYSNEYGEAAFNSLGFEDAYAAMYSTSGAFQWARNFGSGTNEQGNAVTILSDGFLAIAGTNTGNGLIVPVTSAPVNGLSDALIPNQNDDITYCGDSDYGKFRSLEGEGGSDGFVLKAINPSRSPMDFYQRSGGGCDLSIPDACIYLNSGSTVPQPCPESLIACPPYAITASNFTLSGVTFAETFNWSFSGSTGIISLVTSASSESVTISSSDGCYSAADDIDLEIHPDPDIPLISDDQGVNNMAISPQPIYVCPGTTVELSADFPSDYTFQWSGGQFGANPVFTQTVNISEEGGYFIVVTSPEGCTVNNVVSVIYYDIPEDVPPLISFNSDTDSITVCDGFSFTSELLNALDSSAYPIEQYEIDWTVNPGNIEGSGPSVSVLPENSGWYFVSVELTSLDNPCVEDTLIQFASDSIFVEILPVTESVLEMTGPEFYCPGDTLVFYLEYNGELVFDFDPIENFGDSIYVQGAGTYEVSNTIVNEFGCLAISGDFILVQEVESPNIFTDPEEAVVCPGDSVQIFTVSPGVITWQGPSGTVTDTSSIYVQEPGLYFAEVEFYEGCGLVSNTIEVSEFSTPFLDGSNAVLCPGGEVDIQIISSALDDIVWQAPLSGNDTIQTVSEPGIYNVIVTGCGIEIELSIEVELSEYEVEIELETQGPVCSGDSILISATQGLESYEWSPSGNQPDEWFYQTGTVSVIATDEYGCELISNSVQIEFEEIPPPPVFDYELVCEGEPFSLQVISDLGVNFLDNPAGQVISNDPSVLISEFSSDTTFYVFLTNEFCEGPLDSITVSPNPFPDEPIIASDAPVCTGESLTLEVINATGGVSYIWLTPTDEILEGAIVSYGISDLDQEGEYKAYANLQNCLSDTVGIDVDLFLTKQVNLPPDTALCYRPDFTVAPDTVFADYLWQDASTDSVFNPELEASVLLTLTTTDFNGCKSSDIMNIEFADCTVQVPNVFTPNGDGLNDGWIIGLDRPVFYDLVIYNRWGRVVFESKDFTQIWDGTHYETEEPCSEGVYFYILRVNDFEGKAYEQQGDLTLFRE